MGLMKFFAAVFGVSDALSDDEKAERSAAYQPRIEKLQNEKQLVERELKAIMAASSNGINPSDETRSKQAILEGKLRDLEKLIALYRDI